VADVVVVPAIGSHGPAPFTRYSPAHVIVSPIVWAVDVRP